MRPRPAPGVRAVSFKSDHPEWADLAYQVLFKYDSAQPYDLQYAVMQGMMAAYMMGLEGKYPPRPKTLDPRRRPEPEPDPEIDAIFAEMRMLAWSPLSGTEEPEGRMKWAIQRYFALKNPPPKSTAAPRGRPRPVAIVAPDPEPTPAPVVVRRRPR